MMVLGSLLILTTLAVEFAYNTHVAYEIASSERERLQSYYLARSGMNLIRLELKVENQLRSQYGELLQSISGSGVTSDPLCKQLPLSTGLLKGVTSGALLGGEEGGEEESGEEGEPEKKEEEVPEESVPEQEGFFTFRGDFEVSCDSEERKINLNVFRNFPPLTADTTAPVLPVTATPPGAAPSAPAVSAASATQMYEDTKNVLFALMSQKDFEPIFEGKPDEIRKVVNHIADWADRDDQVNEAGGMAGGPEESDYSGEAYHYKVKNGKYASVAELLLVAGVGDDLYRKLEPQVTVYGEQQKIALCQSSDEMVKAFVQGFLQGTAGGLIVISPDDEEKWTAIIESVRGACSQPSPTPAAVAQSIGQVIGLANVTPMTRQITTKNRFYRIESTGSVGETHVKMTSVLDTNGPASKWKTLYFRVE